MGHGSGWTASPSNRAKKIFTGGNRLLHKMDRGRTSCQNPRCGCQEFHLEKHNYQIWDSKSNSCRQRNTVRQQTYQKLLSEIQDQELFLNPKFSSKQWASRGVQQSNPGWNKEEAPSSKGKVGGRAAQRTLGISDYAEKINRRIPLCHGLWHRSSHPIRDRHPRDQNPGSREWHQ